MEVLAFHACVLILLLSRNRSFIGIDLLSLVAAILCIDPVERVYGCKMFPGNAEIVLDFPRFDLLVTVSRCPVMFWPVLQTSLSTCYATF